MLFFDSVVSLTFPYNNVNLNYFFRKTSFARKNVLEHT